MKQPKTSPNVIIEYTDWTQFLPWLTQIAFVLAMGLVIARMLTLETMHDEFSSLELSTVAPRGCGPAGSVVLDLLCCLPALLVLLRRALDKKYVIRFNAAQASLGVFAILALLSTFWASNRAQALILSMHLVAAAMIFWAMAQLVRSWGRLRIVAGVCLGLLLVYIAQGIMYRFVDLPDTINFWKQHRTEEMQAHGWHEGDFELTQYEQKLMNGEMVGFQASPNTLAAVMVLMAVIVAGVGIQRIVNRDESGVIGATVLAIPFAAWIVWYTHSNAAFVSPVIAGGILVGIWKLGGFLNRKRRAAFACGVLIVLGGTLALVGHGMFHGTLPTASLNFRWRYWVASARMFKVHPLLGVGYGNFGDAYLHFRVPAAAEEIKDPHNLLVRAATELGIVGAVVMLAWLASSWWEWTRPIFPPTPAPSKQPHGTRRMAILIGSISILGIAIKLLAAIDFTADTSWVTFELLKHLVYAALLLIGMAIIVVKSTKDTSLDDRPCPWVLYAMLAGLGVFLIHNAIDFSLFEIGPMLLFMTIGGAVTGVRSPSAAGERRRTMVAWISLGLVSAAWLAAGIFIAVPLVQAENLAHSGDDLYRLGFKSHSDAPFQQAAQDYQSAFTASPAKDPDYIARAARALMYLQNAEGAVRAALGNTIGANPNDPMGYLNQARYDTQRHPEERDEIRHDYERALELNPNDLDTRIEYAKLLETYGDRESAAEEYRAALAANDGFDATEPKRLSQARVDEMNQKLKQPATNP